MSDCVRAFPKIEKHPYKVIVFDWDGTAVENRSADARAVTGVLEDLMKLGVYIVVITGTNFDNVNRQFSSLITGPHKQNLFICTNRGSEVYGFSAESEPVVIYKRVATEEENKLLDRVAEAVKHDIESQSSVDIDIVYQRLNRRKIDLIPEWSDPPKSQIGELLDKTEERLENGGFEGGIKRAFNLSVHYADEFGLTDARVTSDVKHVEVGLTDKSDSMKWVIHELSEKRNIPFSDILVLGDEFGPIAGFEGSDFRMYVEDALGITYVSVGKEPNGVPAGIIHTGGGPACFQDLMEKQVELYKKFAPTEDRSFLLIADGYEPLREREIESIFSVGNGYLGTRGSLEEHVQANEAATLVAGVYDKPDAEGLEELVLVPDWVFTKIFVDGVELTLDDDREIIAHRRMLDMKKGIYRREWRHRTGQGRITSVRFTRFASLTEPHAMCMKITVIPENYSGEIRVETGIEQSPPKHAIASRPFDMRKLNEDKGVLFATKTEFSDIKVAQAQFSKVAPGFIKQAYRTFINEHGVSEDWRWHANEGQVLEIEKFVSIYTSRDTADPIQAANESVFTYAGRGFDELMIEHVDAWQGRWDVAAIEIGDDPEGQLWANFSAYHLIIAGTDLDERVSISARSLSGPVYKGHIFWDTEMFMLPFFVYTHPQTARALLMYRYHTLPGARKEARELSLKGALYAWESTTTGEEQTPEYVMAPTGEVILVLSGKMEQHINAAVAHGVWRYWIATRDKDFFVQAGAEMLIETARFWADRAEEHDGVYHILNIEGPDEYHEIVNDSIYTNVMAAWNIDKAADAVSYLKNNYPGEWQALASRIDFDEKELDEWKDVSKNMYRDMQSGGNIIEQFEGYFTLKDINVREFEPRTAPLDTILGREETAASQLVKQADVVLLLYLLENEFSEEVIKENFEYYEQRTGHGSSLSPSIYGLVAARLGFTEDAMRYYRQAGTIDLSNNMGNAAGGVHAAALGGLWQQLIMGFAGVRDEEDGIYLYPRLPEKWNHLRFTLMWHGNRLGFEVERDRQIRLTVEGKSEARVGIFGQSLQVLTPGMEYVAEWNGTAWQEFNGIGQKGVA